jgi:hypothetical protein
MFIATAALLVWSSIRVWEVKNNFFKWGGVSLTALLAAAASFVSVLTIAGLLKLHARSAPVPDLKVAGTAEQIQRGQAIANSFCGACHSKTGPLTGAMGSLCWVQAWPKGPTGQYGEYILSYQDCRECHGANLAVGVEGQLGPIGPDLNLVKEWKNL